LVRPPDAALNAGCRQRSVSVRPSLQLGHHRPVRRPNDSAGAFLVTGKRPGREAAVVLHRVPAALDAAHVGFVFADVIGNGHCGAGTCMAFAFDERQAAVGSTRMPGSGSSWHPLPNATSFDSIWSSYCACRRHQGCHSGETETSVRRRFCWAALGQAAACQYSFMWGVETHCTMADREITC